MTTHNVTNTPDLPPRQRIWSSARWLVVGLLLGAAISATWLRVRPASSQEPAESYQVASHDVTSGEWIIIAAKRDEGVRVQITAVCDFVKWADQDPVEGRSACDLTTGRKWVPNRLGANPSEFLDVFQMGEKLFITQGKGDNRVHQQLSILSTRVLQ